MDKALKQRLVGASVLVALAVVVLPMLLGGQPESPQDERQIDIPPRPQELSFEKRRFPIGEQPPEQPSQVPDRPAPALDTGGGQLPPSDGQPPATTETLQQRLERVAAESPGTDSGEPPEDDAALAPATELAAAEPDIDSPVDDGADADNPGEPPTPNTGETPDPGGESAPLVADPAPAETVQVATADATAGGRYLVQVASFSSTANANRLAGTLRGSGMPVVMDTVDSAAGVLHRVRVGPFEQRAQAEQVVTRLGRQIPDVRPRLVDLRPDDESTVTEPGDPLVRWVVQVGVFSEQANAEQLVFRLRDAGFSASSRAETAGGNTVYRVRVGPEARRENAVSLRDRIEAEQGIKGIVQSTE